MDHVPPFAWWQHHPMPNASGTTTGDVIAIAGDALVLVGLIITLFVFLAQRASSAEQVRQSALAILEGARNGIKDWGPMHFGTDYSGEAGSTRAAEDYDHVMHGRYQQNFGVPAAPLISVIQQPGDGRYVPTETLEAVNIALWRIGQFNQLIEQQSQFNAQHMAEIMGDQIEQSHRIAIALSAQTISLGIHQTAIGNGEWFSDLMAELDRNIAALKQLGPRRWWQLQNQPLPGY